MAALDSLVVTIDKTLEIAKANSKIDVKPSFVFLNICSLLYIQSYKCKLEEVADIICLTYFIYSMFFKVSPGKILGCSALASSLLSFKAFAYKCGDIETTIIDCSAEGGGILGILIQAVNILAAGVGIAALGGFVYAAVLYTTAGGSVEQTKKAITVITNVVIGMVAYGAMWAILNFLVPGGLLK